MSRLIATTIALPSSMPSSLFLVEGENFII